MFSPFILLSYYEKCLNIVLKKFAYVFMFCIIFDPSGFMAHIVWYRENMKEKQLSFIQRLKNMQFGSDAGMYSICQKVMKFWCL